jgi:hypothetical protein
LETLELTERQSARIAELPEDYRVVGVERKAPLVRKPTGQIVRIQQDGRLTSSTLADQPPTRRHLTREQADELKGDLSWHESS